MPIIPDGTRFTLPPEWEWRESLRAQLEGLFSSFGYEAVQTPSLEFYNANHPSAAGAFKLTDRDGSVLVLRGEYTTAVSNLVRVAYPNGPWPLRLRYSGSLWNGGRDPELGRAREYSQVGVELLGVSTPLADVELVTLALEALRCVGLPQAALELGHPGFVRAVLGATGVDDQTLERLRRAVDRKDTPGLAALLAAAGVSGAARAAALALPDLFGGPEVLAEAERVATTPEASEALGRLQAVAENLPDRRFLFDLGMARRFDYYTGVTFRAYTPDFGLPLVGGGRYDGPPSARLDAAAIPAAGFAIGLERLMTALDGPPATSAPRAVAVDAELGARLRAAGWRVEAAWTADLTELETYARARGIPFLAQNGRLWSLKSNESLSVQEALDDDADNAGPL